MIHIIDKQEITEDGITYIVETYSNGGTVKYVKPEHQPEPPEWEKDIIDPTQEAQLEQQMNIQYLVDLAEINMEG